MTSTRRFVLHVRQRAAVQTDRERLHPFALSPARDRPPTIAPYQRCSEFGIRDRSFGGIKIKRRVVKSNLQLDTWKNEVVKVLQHTFRSCLIADRQDCL